jgi:hypothetical protein
MKTKKLVERAFWIANLGVQRFPKSAFLKLMDGASVEEVTATLDILCGKGLFVENRGDICVNNSMLGCGHCKHVLKSDGWHVAENICNKTKVRLAKDISDAGICDDFTPTYLEGLR